MDEIPEKEQNKTKQKTPLTGAGVQGLETLWMQSGSWQRQTSHSQRGKPYIGESDIELIHLKSFFAQPHYPHCDLNTILVTAVTDSLKSTLSCFYLSSPRLALSLTGAWEE